MGWIIQLNQPLMNGYITHLKAAAYKWETHRSFKNPSGVIVDKPGFVEVWLVYCRDIQGTFYEDEIMNVFYIKIDGLDYNELSVVLTEQAPLEDDFEKYISQFLLDKGYIAGGGVLVNDSD